MGEDNKKQNKLIARFVAYFALIISVLFFHWLVVLAVALFCLFFFDNFYEAVFAGLLIDMLYGLPIAKFLYFPFFFTAVFLLVFVFAFVLKQKIRNYD